MKDKNGTRNKFIRKAILVLMDAFFVIIAYALANYFIGSECCLKGTAITYVVLITVHIALYLLAKVYRSIAEYTGAREYAIYVGVTLLADILSYSVLSIINAKAYTLKETLLSTFFISGLMIGARVGFRLLNSLIHTIKLRNEQAEKILIVGAGKASLQIIINLVLNINKRYKIVGIIDDYRTK